MSIWFISVVNINNGHQLNIYPDRLRWSLIRWFHKFIEIYKLVNLCTYA